MPCCCEKSFDPVRRVWDPPVKPALRRPAVERHREVAERVGRVRGPVVHGRSACSLQISEYRRRRERLARRRGDHNGVQGRYWNAPMTLTLRPTDLASPVYYTTNRRKVLAV